MLSRKRKFNTKAREAKPSKKKAEVLDPSLISDELREQLRTRNDYVGTSTETGM